MKIALPCLLVMMVLSASPAPCADSSSESAPFPFSVPRISKNEDFRAFDGYRARVALAEALFEAGKIEAAREQLRLVERKVAATPDGFLFRSGNYFPEEKLAAARDANGFRFGIRRSGHQGKSPALRELARLYAGRGEEDTAKNLVRRIPSTSVQLSTASELVGIMLRAGRVDEALEYRKEVLEAGDWDPSVLAQKERLETNYLFRFAKNSAIQLLLALQRKGLAQASDSVAREMRPWLVLLGEGRSYGHLRESSQIAFALIRYYIDTGRPAVADAIVEECSNCWLEANAQPDPGRDAGVIKRARERQLVTLRLVQAQRPGGAFPVTSASLTRFPEEVAGRFLELELLENSAPDAARKGYAVLGREFLEDPKRCKRYLDPVIDALVRLGEEETALELAAKLQERLPFEKIEGCPVSHFQQLFLRYVQPLDISSLAKGIRRQEEKLDSPEKWLRSGIALAKTYEKARDRESALRMLGRTSEVALKQKDYSALREVVRVRHALAGEIRDTEIRKLVEFAQIESRRHLKLKVRQVAEVARLFITLGRLDWAEALIDAITPVE